MVIKCSTHPLYRRRICREPRTERPSAVPRIVKPADLLSQHRLEGQTAHAQGQALTGNGEHEDLR